MILSKPRGFCRRRSCVDIVELALKKYGPPVYVRHEIVHNKRVVEDLKAKGAVFVEELDEVPEGAHTVFSAHGVSQKVADVAESRNLPVIDATCPLVAKVHKEGQRYSADDFDIILIGHEGHPEVVGTMGRILVRCIVSSVDDVAKLTVNDPAKLAYVTQTTLSVDDTRDVIEALKSRLIQTLRICYATQNRQTAVRVLSVRLMCY